MELNERQKEIFDLICENKKMSVSSLAKILYVTEMTIRRDLTELSEKGSKYFRKPSAASAIFCSSRS